MHLSGVLRLWGGDWEEVATLFQGGVGEGVVVGWADLDGEEGDDEAVVVVVGIEDEIELVERFEQD